MSTTDAAELMLAFAERTGLNSERAPDRYLWTDAFAVCNFLGLARQTGQERYAELADALVDQVHHVLGRHRDDDPRQGWLSGLDEADGEAHPTLGGLRIGKQLPERGPDEPYDRRLEWERDGQYFHYLTKWMYALDAVGHATGEVVYNRWARELAEAAHDGFVYRAAGHDRPQMYWKMSIDLSRPLVPSMGHHDPLDGYITVEQLRATADELDEVERPVLDVELQSFAQMIRGRDWTTTDPLGLGGLLIDATRLARLIDHGHTRLADLFESVCEAAHSGLRRYAVSGQLDLPAQRRLGFRELGLAIGLAGVARLVDEPGLPDGPEAFEPHLGLADIIVAFWSEDDHRQASTWTGHQNINDVMLATALAPQGLLELPRV